MSDWYGFEGEEGEEKVDESQPSLPIAPVMGGGGFVVPPRTPVSTPAPAPVVQEDIKTLVFNDYRHCGMEWSDTAEKEVEDQCSCCGQMVMPWKTEVLI